MHLIDFRESLNINTENCNKRNLITDNSNVVDEKFLHF